MEFVLKNPCQQLCSFSLAPCQRSYACPIAQCLHTAWQVLGAQCFGTIALMEFVARPALPSHSLQRSSPQAIFTLHSPSTLVRRFRLAPSSGDPPKLFPSYFYAFHSVRACAFLPSFLPAFLPSLLVRLFCLAPLAAKEAKREPKHRRCFWE